MRLRPDIGRMAGVEIISERFLKILYNAAFRCVKASTKLKIIYLYGSFVEFITFVMTYNRVKSGQDNKYNEKERIK
jgi:uncharacterized membrane protein